MNADDSSENMNLIFFLSQFDFLSQKPTLLINNSERIRSISGAVLTFIVWSITIMSAIFILLDFNMNSLPYVIRSSSYQIKDYISFDLNNFPIMFSILDKTTFQRADFSEVKFALTLFTHQYSFFENASTIHKIVSEKPLNYSVCDNAIPESVSNRNKTKFTIKNNYFCLNNSDYEKLKFVSDSNDSSIYYYSEINLDVICSSNNCDKLLNSFILSFAIVENFIDLSNTYNPNNTVLKLKNFPLTSMMSLNLNIELKQGSINTDIGYLNKILDTRKYYVVNSNEFFYFKSYNDSEKIASVRIFQDNIQDNIYRHYNKLPILFAQIGGVYYILYMIANNLNTIYSVVHFYLTIDNNTKISYYIQKVIKDLSKGRISKEKIKAKSNY